MKFINSQFHYERRYIAGPDGFYPQGAHLPVAPVA